MGKPPSAKPPSDKSRKKAFSVGPANLPDGTYKRKVDKIKKSLIHKAKIKKSFAKTISGDTPDTDPHAIRAKMLLEEAAAERERAKYAELKDGENGDATTATTEMHPERRAALDQPEAARAEEDPKNVGKGAWKKREKRKKTSAFLKEEREAAKLREKQEEEERQIEARKVAMEKSKKERALRRKVMSARTAKGQQKLGRQSVLLLEKVKAQAGV
ncbi:hypothetical protein C7212DRAFT_317758 [Tuber magnatum]|uniref:rRNA-processing protein FYV7 n=1 Tax=Tuber magnatum TaxID=42249 RepID=A0A317SPZ7_9PEZI|nr:hypothetical protein C7212DRAFT_317758 [Tuber magnatum]